MSENWMTSIGLDIGTSTTKFIVSKLLIAERGNTFSLPNCQIIDRKISYESKIYTTPLLNQYEIDIDQLAHLLDYEYSQSKTTLDDVKAGAVIITGETARKQNAERIIHYLSERAGDFVVATAGASLEGILAGKGSGAAQQSEKTEGVIANIDIGGGTANVALFQYGKAVQTFTFHVGGRLIRLDEQGVIEYISPHLNAWLTINGFSFQESQTISYEQLQTFCITISESMISYLSSTPIHHPKLLLVEKHEETIPTITEMIFSGGVGQMMLDNFPSDMREVTTYGDFGPLLGSCLQKVATYSSIKQSKAIETTRATVIGAGMQNTEVSGATTFVNKNVLPIKNVPFIKQNIGEWNFSRFNHQLNLDLIKAKQLFQESEQLPFAIALEDVPYCSYDMLQELSSTLYSLFTDHFPKAIYLVVLCENDMAKALGQALTKYNLCNLEIICIDQINFSYGDYIDLGLPVSGSEAISISIKTLAF